MLEELTIRNFALIEELTVAFSSGLNILSGETGAGKSIIVGALGLLLGVRADSGSIRTGCDEAQVSGVIEIPDSNEASIWLKEHSIEPEDGRIIIRRIIKQSGRGSVFIQSVPATLKDLEELTSYLFDMHGQHSHQSLLNLESQRKILDKYAGLEDQVENLRLDFQRLSELKSTLSEISNSEREMAREKELLEFSIEEISKAALKSGEETELLKEKELLIQHEKLMGSLEECRASLSENSGGALAGLRKARTAMDTVAEIADDLKPQAQRLDSAFYEIEDVLDILRKFESSVDFSPDRLEACEDRLQIIHRMQKKYGDTVEEVLEYGKNAEAKLASMESADKNKENLGKEIASLEKSVLAIASNISSSRSAAAEDLKQRIEENLAPMGMPKARFLIEVSPRANGQGKQTCGPSGMDRIEFMISPNQGEPMKPLKNIASGGELSRIMLSIKSVLAESDSVLSLIFDEIDTGIGGEVALSVGEHLAEISQHRQILCITHLASIAVHADNHIKVRKKVADGRTYTVLERIGSSERVEEIARMLSGDSSGAASLEHARDLLKRYGR